MARLKRRASFIESMLSQGGADGDQQAKKHEIGIVVFHTIPDECVLIRPPPFVLPPPRRTIR